jgi:hypothetical protein
LLHRARNCERFTMLECERCQYPHIDGHGCDARVRQRSRARGY